MGYGRAVSASETATVLGPAPEKGSGPKGVPRQDPRLHWAVTLGVIAITFATVRPLGVQGRGLAVLALLVVNSVALMARHLSESKLPPRTSFVWLAVGIVAAASLIGVGRSGSTYLFAYFLVGHAGYRLPLKQALSLAALCSLLCGAVLYFRLGPGHEQLAWTVGLTTGIPVVAGILSRSRQRAVEAMVQSAEAAERAARAEAQAAVLTERSRIA
ncbi:MAG: two-component sensor histidine kinase, partial [Nonomuraea sp.]|nr:two-component sensor histidine kinase [Nonomuraea sp.]